MSAARTWQPSRLIRRPAYRYGFFVLMGLYVIATLFTMEIDWSRVVRGLPRAVDIFARMFPPDFGRWELLLKGVVESVQMALAASFFGMILAIP